MTASQEDIEHGLRELGLGEDSHVLVHSSYKAFGGVEGGPATVTRALVNTFSTLMMPASTWEHTAVWDESGLFDGNAYREEAPESATAEAFGEDTPIDRGIGVIPETFRTVYDVCRSSHPLQSFVAYGERAEFICGPGDDTVDVAPIERLMGKGGELLLIGVSHTNSTAVHLAERLAGRQSFVRHALTAEGVMAVYSGGCSNAFDDLQPHVDRLERRASIGRATLRCYRLRPYVDAARALIERDPHALLCDCVRCDAHRSRVPA